MDVEGDEVPTAPWWVWLGLSIIAAISFWCQATVTEERLVPALNVISDYYNIPSDIAGATLMAAGASSPELFSSIVSLFITHSSLGLGTIVGSEIFNQLIICAGAVYASKTGDLKLDKAIVTREVGFYALAIVLLYIALEDVEPTDDDMLGVDHIFISFWEACMVFSGYILYVIVCANMQSIVRCFEKTGERLTATLNTGGYGSLSTKQVKMDDEVPIDMPYVTRHTSLSQEPAANWKHVQYFMPQESFLSRGEEDAHKEEPKLLGGEHSSSPRYRRQSSLTDSFARLLHRQSSLTNSFTKYGRSVLMDMLKHTERPTELHSMYDVENNEITGVLRCFLWQASPFYTKAYFASHAWHLRWFTITDQLITSVPDRQDPDQHRMKYPRFTHLHVDDDRLIIKMVNPVPNKRDYTVMAPSRTIFMAVLEKLDQYMKWHTSTRPDTLEAQNFENLDDNEVDCSYDDADVHVDLIEYPSGGGNFEVIMWILLFPLRFVMHYTLPDVRQLDRNGDPTATITTAYFATFMCLVWLIIGSYAMVASLEDLAELMDIPDAVIGFTVSAAGTSLPNYIASKVAAENGFGNQAVSNAFGSNTFNIMVGLGLPWLLYTSFGTGFEPYHALPAEGILESIIILASVLLVFVILMLQSGFIIYKWHGIVFLAMYAAYIAFAIASVYLK